MPTFFILSGATFFRNYTNSSYLSKLKARFHTLVLPYLIWNTVWMLFDMVCSYTFLSRFFIGRPLFELSLVNILQGIFLWKCNLPFWFILNLIIFIVFSPFIHFLISKKALAFVSLGCLMVLRLFGFHLPTSTFFAPNALIYYFIGAIIGKYYWEKLTQKASRRAQWISLSFLGAYILAKTICKPDVHSFITPLFEVIIFCLCALSLWNAADLIIDRITPKPFLSRSFANYAMHTNISAVITKLFALACNKKEIFAIPNMLFTFVTTLLLINLFCTVTERFFPKFYSLIMGKR